MRTTITIDDELYRKALEVADPGIDKADLVREAMLRQAVVSNAQEALAPVEARGSSGPGPFRPPRPGLMARLPMAGAASRRDVD